MEYIAVSKNIKITPRKVRLVSEAVKKLTLPRALAQLEVMDKRAALPVKKALESAVANALHNGNASRDKLTIKEIMIGEGIAYKRYHYAARGRVRPYVKRTSHIRVVIEDNMEVVAPKVEEVAPAEKVEEPKKTMKKETKKRKEDSK